LTNFFNNRFKGKKEKKKERHCSNPEVLDIYNDNYIDMGHSKQRSNTLSALNNSPTKSNQSLNKRSSYIEIRQTYDMISPISPTMGRPMEIPPFSPVKAKELQKQETDIDSILILADETENNINNNDDENNGNGGLSPKSKNLEKRSSSSSTFLSNLKFRKGRNKSTNNLSCITNSDLMHKKKSFIYSVDAALVSHESVRYSSANPQNSQIIINDDVLKSANNGDGTNENDQNYHLPEYSDLIVMSESDIDGIYNNMVNDKQKNNIKRKSKNNIGKEKETKEKNLKEKEFATIIPLKPVDDSEDQLSPSVMPTVQNNRDDPLRKSLKSLNESYQMGSFYDVNTPQTPETKNLSINVEDNSVYVVINPYGIRDIDFSSRHVIPVNNSKNCSQDVDDLFNIEHSLQYQNSVCKLNEIETNKKLKKKISEVVIPEPAPSNDIDTLFLLSSDIEKKMSVMDSLIVVDDIQETIRPDITDLINMGDNENNNNNALSPKSAKSYLGSSTPNLISPKNFFRRLSKNFSSSTNKLNAKVVENKHNKSTLNSGNAGNDSVYLKMI